MKKMVLELFTRFFIVIFALVLVLSTGEVFAQKRSPKQILFGATVCMTGHFAPEVRTFKRLMDTWTQMVNEKGGIYVKEYSKRIPIKFIVYDDKSDESTAKRFYERLATVDKVDLMFGPYASPLTFASSTAAENNKIPFLAICANSPKVYDRGFQWIACVIDAAGRYTYRYWEMLKSEGLAKSVSFVVEDTLHPLGVYKGGTPLAEKAGLKILSGDIAPAATRDFTSIITKIKSLDPDIVYVSSNIPLAITFMKQAKELDLNPREFQCIHHGGEFKEALGKDANYVLGQSYWTHGMKYGDPDRFVELIKRSKVDLDEYPWAPAYMMAFEIVEQAIERAGTLEKATVMEFLKKGRFMTIGGEAYFAPNGVGSINAYPSQIQNGKYFIVYPPETAPAKHIYPTPKWTERK